MENWAAMRVINDKEVYTYYLYVLVAELCLLIHVTASVEALSDPERLTFFLQVLMNNKEVYSETYYPSFQFCNKNKSETHFG